MNIIKWLLTIHFFCFFKFRFLNNFYFCGRTLHLANTIMDFMPSEITMLKLYDFNAAFIYFENNICQMHKCEYPQSVVENPT